MQLRKLILNHFCQHVYVEADFPPGITGILGGNGRGKSNLIKAARFALIGTSGNAGAKLDDLNLQAASNGESGSVELDFDVNGTAGKVKRMINTTKASLKFGSDKFSGANAITDRILGLSGYSKRIMEDIIFVLQGKIEDILFEQPADRMKKMQGLFGIENTERIRQLLNQEAALLTTDPIDDRIRELQTQLDTKIDTELRALNDAKTAIVNQLTVDTEALKILTSSYQQYVLDKQRVEKLTQRRNELGVALQNNHAEELAARAASLRVAKANMANEADAARAALLSAKTEAALITTRANLEKTIVDCIEILKESAPAEASITLDTINQAKAQLAAAQLQLDQVVRYLDLYYAGAGGNCELCGQPLNFTKEKISESVEFTRTQPTIINEVKAMIELGERELRNRDAEQVRYVERQQQATVQKQRAEEQLVNLPQNRTVTVSADAETTLATFDNIVARLTELENQTNAAQQEHARIRGELHSIDEQLSTIFVNPPCSEEEYTLAVNEIKAAEERTIKLAGIDGQLQQLHNARMRTLAELEGLKQQAGSLEVKRKYKQLCTDARDVLHRDVLPQQVMQQYLGALNAELAKYLQLFAVPFTCVIDNELNVSCRVGGGPPQVAERLSGGQRVMLGIAFRFAIYSMFAAKLGFMVLDEPTVHLDEDNVTAIADMMKTIRSHALSAGLQLIVITHEAALASAFDHIIQL